MFDWLTALCQPLGNPAMYSAMFALDPLTLQMQACEQQIIQQNLQNPRVQALYQQHQAQGGWLSPEQFAYQYAATGGFTPEGKASYYAHEQANQTRETIAFRGLQQAEATRAAAQEENQAHFAANQQTFGTQLMGNSTWFDPQTAQAYTLPHTLAANSYYYDPATQRQFFRDAQGHYHVYQNGWWYELGQKQ